MEKSVFKLIRTFSALALCFTVANCSSDPDSFELASGGSGEATTDNPIIVQVSTQWEDSLVTEFHEFTETGTTECAISDANPSRTCTVVIPEGQLFRSNLTFTWSYDVSTCGSLIFNPSYYRASVDPNYLAPFGTVAQDCSSADETDPIACFAGPATEISPGFPNFLGLINFPTEESGASTESATIQSPFLQGYDSNRPNMNDLAAGVRATDFDPDGGAVAEPDEAYYGTIDPMPDNFFQCRDEFAENPMGYDITIIITDDDGTTDEFEGW